MTGNSIDNIRYQFRRQPAVTSQDIFYLDTDYGKIRVLDTKEMKPILINVPDGPNVIEHQMGLIKQLSANFRVVCFEYPGVGFSFPNKQYNYTIDHGTKLLIQVMDSLKLERVSVLFSCSNGYYAINLAQINPDRIQHIFLSQTPSISAILDWTNKSIPNILEVPILGQAANAILVKKLVKTWYKLALPRELKDETFVDTALKSINKGGCFCLSSLVIGLKKSAKKQLWVDRVPTTLVWGTKDFTHRKTDMNSINDHIKDCEIIEFSSCGHFPDLEDTKKMVQLINEKVF